MAGLRSDLIELMVTDLLNNDKTSDSIVDLLEIDAHSRIKDFLEQTMALDDNLSAEDLATSVIGKLDIREESLVNYTRIEATNVLNLIEYENVPIENRILLIPHCLRDAERCIAPIDDEGYHCKKCGACIIADITRSAEVRGLKWYMVGGGSHAIKIVKKARPWAVLGIACYDDASMAVEKINGYDIPTQAVLLSKDGCVNTEVDFDKVITKLDIA
ncbi:MAG: DUF116 domain-containing protein [Candidatus Thorarchaeota archaeon]